MPPRAVQVPMCTWFTCDDMGNSPVIVSSTVKVPGPVVTVIVPLAVVPRPFRGNFSGAGEGVEAGVLASGLGDGEGDGDDPVPVEPHAAVIRKRAVSATNLLNLEFPDHVCPPALPMKVT